MSTYFCRWLFSFLVLLLTAAQVFPKFEFTNIKCSSLDKKFSDFEYCYLKSINRSYKYASVKANLFKLPITKIRVTGILYKRFNVYRPFMYNVSIDACKFLKNPESNLLAKFYYEFLKSYSNINHTCPYDHSLILDKLPASFVNNQLTKELPFPEGDYILETHWIAYDVDRAVVKFYGTLS